MNRWSVFKELWSIQWRNYWKDIFNISLGFVLTLLTMLIWLTFKDTNPDGLRFDPFVLAAAIGVSVIRNCLFNFARTIMSFKKRNVFNQLFSTPVSKRMIVVSMILFNNFINLMINIILFSIAMLYKDQREIIVNINVWMSLLGYFLLIITCNLIAFFVGFNVKTIETGLLIGNMFYFFGVYLLGLGIPLNILSKSKFIIFITYFFPTKYALNIMQAGWVNSKDFLLDDANGVQYETDGFGYGGEALIPYIVSISIIFILIILCAVSIIKKFDYGNRKYKKFRNFKKHNIIISAIKKANTINELNEVLVARDEINNLNIKERKKHESKRKSKNY